jgi:hypothetical protein
MSDAASLRSLLSRTDVTAPAIQASAGAMMRHYDKSPGVAVVEWRNALHQARPDQHLPLLYVANEVLQNSKRNRGNKFLEAFSPVLGQSLMFICEKAPVVERVRRTVKIWGDRHVFSIRYVNELLKGLELYRNGNGGSAANAPQSSSSPRFSPSTHPPPSPNHHVIPSSAGSSIAPKSPSPRNAIKKIVDIDMEMARLDDDDYDGNLGSPMHHDDDDDDDDDDDNDDMSDGDLFGDEGGIKMDIQIDLDRATTAVTTAMTKRNSKSGVKRRRSSTGSTSLSKQLRRKSTILSTNSLMELWNQVNSLQQSYDHAQTILSQITPEYLNVESSHIESLVGDELLDTYKQNLDFEKRVADQRRELHRIAQKRRACELVSVRYLPWLENTQKTDAEDMIFCTKLEENIQVAMHVHRAARAARDERVAEEATRRQQEEELLRKKQEEEERKRFMESAMKKETEEKPGMVWNRATGEYQYLQTEESWRD